jgi:hypothetical protein
VLVSKTCSKSYSDNISNHTALHALVSVKLISQTIAQTVRSDEELPAQQNTDNNTKLSNTDCEAHVSVTIR